MLRIRQLLIVSVLGVLVLGHPGSASAALTICNKTSSPASVAIGVIIPALAITHGWYNVQPGACTVYPDFDGTDEAKGSATYYAYAHSSGGAWSGDKQLCVDMTNLQFDFARPSENPLQNCGNGDGGAAKGFRRLNLKTKDAELDLDQLY